MIELKTKLRRWGNSFGIVVPQTILKEKPGLKENEEITVFISQSRPNLKKLFGAHKFRKSTNQMMREIDKELYND